THWNESFRSDTVRRYPPIASFTLRNWYHAIAGFSVASSRVFSALLMLVVIAGALWFMRRAELTGWQRCLVLCQIGLTPVMIYTARTVRFEQEILFAGWMGSALLPALLPCASSAWLRGLLWIGAGAALALAGSSHPFGLVFGIVGLWLVVFADYWRQQDGFRLWQRLGLVALGLLLAGIPTFDWVFSDWETFRAFSESLTVLYAGRSRDLIEWYADMPPWNQLNGILPRSAIAHLTVLHMASYEDFFNYPVPNYRFRIVLHAIFYAELLLIAGFLAFSVWRRFRNANPWIHLAVWLAAAFIAFGCWYTPIHTYKIYTSFFVNLSSAHIAWRLVSDLRTRTNVRAVWLLAATAAAVPALFFLHFGYCHMRHVLTCHNDGVYTHVALDVEFKALADMADRLELRCEDRKVYTYIETWIAAGKHPLSLWESVREGLVEPRTDADAVVFHNNNVGIFTRIQPRDTPERIAGRRQELDRLRALVGPMRLAGVIVNDFQPSAAYSFYQRSDDHASPPLVARLQRDQQVVFYEASFDRDIPSGDTPSLLTPGVYLLLARIDDLAQSDFLEVSYSSGGETVKKSVYLTPLHTAVPAPILVEIEGATPAELRLGFTPQQTNLAKTQLYRLHARGECR
ncbi:MAG TPA: hypothetical protein VFE62_00835, partial [Gemmataceae bacterium]|nr:hypothetical protein [Gemmataceae bacterium]